jgi:diguanylate cyclase (GGDEF)-like protein
MFNIDRVQDDLSKLCSFSQLFQFYRLVDPLSHRIYELKNGKPEPTDLPLCYEIWHRDLPCINCISARTCREHNIFHKLEFLDDAVFLIASVPTNFDDRLFSLELISDVTKSMVVGDSIHKGHIDVMRLIGELNDISTRDEFTSLYNRNFMKSKIEYLANPDKKSAKVPFCYSYFDIDDLRDVNSKYGHSAGDDIIHRIAGLLNRYERLYSGIYAGRMGDDEFGLIYEGYSIDKATEIARQIANEVNTSTFESSEGQDLIKIHISWATGQYKDKSYCDFMDTVEQEMFSNREKSNK